MAPLRSLGNTASIFDDFYGRTGKDAVTPPVVPPFVFNSGTTYDIASTSTNDKVVIAYQDASNSNYGTAVVGTINLTENTITFGTPQEFWSAATDQIAIAYDSINDRVVIAFEDEDNYNYGRAVVGTITGDTLNFNGSSTVFHNDDTTEIDAVYDINAQRIVIGYRNNGPGGNQAGDYEGKVVVGTVDPSNNTISFATEQEFSSTRSAGISIAYDTLTRQIVVAYADTDSSNNIGKVNVGQVHPSNGAITWNANGGGPYTFATDVGYVSATYCSLENNTRVVVAYRDNGDSNKGKVRVGNVSGGGTITFPSGAVEFESNTTSYIKTAYDPKNGKVVITYKASSKLKSIQGTVSGNTITFDSSEEIVQTNGEMSLSYVSAAGKLVAAYQGLYQGNNAAGTASIVGAGSSDYIIYGGDVSGLQPGNGYQYHTFIEPGTLTITGSPVTAEVLMVGGGGAGGSDGGGGGTAGGGAGGLLYGTLNLTAGSYPIVVAESTPNNEGTSGNPTTAFGATAQGGGFGQYAGQNNLSPGMVGGSGGGGSAGSPGGVGGESNQTPQVLPYGTLTGYGHTGGSGGGPGSPRAGGGGGGAGGHGQVIPVDLRPNADNGGGPSSGGDGKQYSNFGGELIGIGPLAPLNAWFAGGGGGALGSSTNGGNGGGGAGAPGTGTQASDANNHSGGGGGGAAIYPNPGNGGGSGASGIVVLRINI